MLNRLALTTALITGTVVPFAVATPAAAQTTQTQVPAPLPGEPAAPLNATASDLGNDIIVTATRRSERLQDVPISVTAVRGETLTERGVTSPEELSRLSPTLTTESAAANQQGTNFSIRGVGTGSFQRSVESSVATVIDDVTLIRPEMGIVNFFDVDQVEVLNGPQGMLFGKNASAGLISIHTANPIMNDTSFRVGTEYGRLNTSNNTSQFRTYGVANIPLSDNLSTRFNLLYQYNTPIYRNLGGASGIDAYLRETVGQGKLLWQPHAGLSVLIAGDYADLRGLGPGLSSFRSTSPGSPFGFINGVLGITASPDNTFTSYELRTFARTQLGGGQVKLDIDLGGGTQLTNILAARAFRIRTGFDPDYSALPLVQLYQEPRGFRQVSDELRIASPTGGRFDYQVGLYGLLGHLYQDQLAGATLGMAVPPGLNYILGDIARQQQDLQSYAIFGQGTYRITDQLRAIVGARFTYDDVRMQVSSTNNGVAIPLIPFTPPVEADRHATNLSWRGILQYDLTPDVMFYGTAARGYKGPGFSQYSLQYVRPETSTHFEVGAKMQFLNRRLTLNLSAFNTSFRDFQSQTVDFSTLSIFVTNAGRLVTRGFDAQLNARPARGLTLTGGLAYVDARFREFQGDICYPGQTTCVGGFSNSSGNRLPNSPEWKGVGDVRYEWAFAPWLNGNVELGFASQTRTNFFSNGDPNAVQHGYTTFDVSAGLAGHPNSWRVSVFCRNCTDHRFDGAVAPHPLNTSDYIQNYSYASFRSIGAAFEVSF